MFARSTFVLGVVLTLVAAAPASAQGKFGDRAPTRSEVEFRQAVSVSPIGALVGIYAGEYERVLTENLTAGVGLSRWVDDAWSLTFIDLKSRFYPGASPLQGFSVGAQVGYFQEGFDAESGTDFGGDAGITFGGDAGYSRILGRIYLGIGAGLKLVSAEPLPTGRLSIGLAF